MNKQKPFRFQQGAAVITALLVVALIVTIVASYVVTQNIAIRRTQQLITADKAYLYAKGVLPWAIGILNADRAKTPEEMAAEHWPRILPPTPIDGGQVMGSLEDLQARYNVNVLTNPKYLLSFAHFLRVIDQTLSETDSIQITQAIAEWIKPKQKSSASFSTYYQNENPPYREANRLMVSVSELRLVHGMSPSLYEKILPYVIALPTQTQVNINTAPLPVLIAVGLREEQGNAIIQYRVANGGFVNNAQVKQFLNEPTIDMSRISTVSNYFLAKADVEIDHQYLLLNTAIHLKTTSLSAKEPKKISVLWESRGSL